MFVKIGSLGRFGGPVLVDRVITNSVTVAVGDMVNTTSGFAALATTGARLLGVVESIIGKDGFAPVKDGSYLGNPGSTYTAGSSNQTTTMASVRVDASTDSLYLATGDAAFGTTSGSNLAGKTFDLHDEVSLDESTVAETKQQVYSHGLDRLVTTNVVINVLESEVFGF